MIMKNNEDRSSSFETSDFPLCVTLLTLGFTIDALNGADPNRIVFCFSQTDSLIDSIKKYWTGQLSVEPKSFWNAQRELKARIRNGV